MELIGYSDDRTFAEAPVFVKDDKSVINSKATTGGSGTYAMSYGRHTLSNLFAFFPVTFVKPISRGARSVRAWIRVSRMHVEMATTGDECDRAGRP